MEKHIQNQKWFVSTANRILFSGFLTEKKTKGKRSDASPIVTAGSSRASYVVDSSWMKCSQRYKKEVKILKAFWKFSALNGFKSLTLASHFSRFTNLLQVLWYFRYFRFSGTPKASHYPEDACSTTKITAHQDGNLSSYQLTGQELK